MKWLKRLFSIRLDAWEVVLLVVLAVLATRMLWPVPVILIDREARYFHKRYGPDHASENEEEWVVRHFFADRRDGVFVEVGAHHYFIKSKTWYLETKLGWSGLAVEPNRDFEADYARHRPRTRFLPFFVGDRSDGTAKLYVISGETATASGNPEFTRQFGTPDRVDTVPTITMNDLLTRSNVTKIDYLSIDIELNEPQALAGFDVQRFSPQLVCVEALLPVRQQILNYFTQHGYVVNGRYLRADRENLYFVPLSFAQSRRPGDDGSHEKGAGAIEGIHD